MIDIAKVRRETIRWILLLTLNNSRPQPLHERVILSVVQAEYPDSSQLEIRKELDYLAVRDLIKVNKRPDGVWISDLTRYGVDIVEYTLPVEPGIARPEKYFNA